MRFKISFLVCLVLTLSACLVTPPKIPLEPLQPLSESECKDLGLNDLGDPASLSQAIAGSLEYFQRLPKTARFKYGEYEYSPSQMIESFQIFQSWMGEPSVKNKASTLVQKFHCFESRNENGEAFFTGYYEPILPASWTPKGELNQPLYEVPLDLIQVDLGEFHEDLKGKQIIGKFKQNHFVPYDTRKEIVNHKSLRERAQVIAYTSEVELFFLQIQGSGLLQFSDSSRLRVNYAHKNGRPYKPIGKVLLEQGKIPKEKMSMQSIKNYLKNHPQEADDILNTNPSYTFFRKVDRGPLGNIEVPLTPTRSLAMDHRLIPKGALAFVITQYPKLNESLPLSEAPLRRFFLVQDTGGAIRGAGRGDIFWGNGPQAEEIAGNFQQHGRVFIFVAKKEYLKEHN